ncbi:MAG: tyrosine recombinase [Lachnospiraceae bacterium]|nr:tyrosine recombinase [Lachnospiraceae bacterium]
MKQKIEDFLVFLINIKGIAKNTEISYRRDLNNMIHFFENSDINSVKNITFTNINSYILYMEKQGKSPSSVSRNISCMRSFFRYLLNKGEIQTDPTMMVTMPKVEKKQPEVVSANTMEMLIKAPSAKDAKGIRDKAMIQLLYATGMRVSELIRLSLEDLNMDMRYVTLHNSKKVRIVSFDTKTKNILKKYLSESRNILADDKIENLFVNCNGKEMTRQGFWKIIKGYAKEIGITEDISPHTLRHSFGAHLMENGADIKKVSEAMGHSDISYTNIYAKMTEDKLREMYNKTH